MTVEVRNSISCPRCGGQVQCIDCGCKKIHQQSPFSDWLRALKWPRNSTRFSNQNLDYIWHCHVQNWFITIEEKRYTHPDYTRPNLAQLDTHGIVTKMLSTASGCEVSTWKHGLVNCEYRGHYIIYLEHTTPDDGSMWINMRWAGKKALMYLLLHGRLPDTDNTPLIVWKEGKLVEPKR